MYKNKAEQEAAEKRMAKNANIWGAISVAFIGICGLRLCKMKFAGHLLVSSIDQFQYNDQFLETLKNYYTQHVFLQIQFDFYTNH